MDHNVMNQYAASQKAQAEQNSSQNYGYAAAQPAKGDASTLLGALKLEINEARSRVEQATLTVRSLADRIYGVTQEPATLSSISVAGAMNVPLFEGTRDAIRHLHENIDALYAAINRLSDLA